MTYECLYNLGQLISREILKAAAQEGNLAAVLLELGDWEVKVPLPVCGLSLQPGSHAASHPVLCMSGTVSLHLIVLIVLED